MLMEQSEFLDDLTRHLQALELLCNMLDQFPDVDGYAVARDAVMDKIKNMVEAFRNGTDEG